MISEIKKPTLIIDRARCVRNITQMAEKAAGAGVRLRPHFKTHQNCRVGSWFRENSINAITVSSVDMSRKFAGCGFTDILIAFPVNVLQLPEIEELSRSLELGLLIDGMDTLKELSQSRCKASVWIEIDCGHHRTGISWKDTYSMGEILEELKYCPNLKAAGFLTHSGNTYKAKSLEQIEFIYRTTEKRMFEIREHFRPLYPHLQVSVGDTPGCSITEDLGRVNEIRPGNFVFFDVMQLTLGSCIEEQLACAVACPVVSIRPERKEFIVYGGAVHLSKEGLEQGDSVFYGYVCPLSPEGWQTRMIGTYVASLSQEHGVVKTTDYVLEKISIGDLVAILPVHSCLAADLLRDSFLIL